MSGLVPGYVPRLQTVKPNRASVQPGDEVHEVSLNGAYRARITDIAAAITDLTPVL